MQHGATWVKSLIVLQRVSRSRTFSDVIQSFKEAEQQYKQGLPFLLSSQECLARLGSPEEDSEKENQDVGEGSSHGFLHLIPDQSSSPIPIPPPKKKPSLEKVTQDLRDEFVKERKRFLDGMGAPLWLEHQLERESPEPHVERSGVRYVSVSDVDGFLDTVNM